MRTLMRALPTRARAHARLVQVAAGPAAEAKPALPATVSWRGRSVRLDESGLLDAPLRYVPSVGRVPATHMPFREKVYEQQAEVSFAPASSGPGGGAAVLSSTTSLLIPEVAIDEDAIGGCGGKDCPLWTTLSKEVSLDATLPSGAFSAGPRLLDPTLGVMEVDSCLVSNSGERVYAIQRVIGEGGQWLLESLDVIFTKGSTPVPVLERGEGEVKLQLGVEGGCVTSRVAGGAEGLTLEVVWEPSGGDRHAATREYVGGELHNASVV